MLYRGEARIPHTHALTCLLLLFAAVCRLHHCAAHRFGRRSALLYDPVADTPVRVVVLGAELYGPRFHAHAGAPSLLRNVFEVKRITSVFRTLP